MAQLHGKAGKVVWNAEDTVSDVDLSTIQSWNLDAVADTAETTGMASTWKTFLGGWKEWTATVECNAVGAPEVPYVRSGVSEGLAESLEVDGVQKVFIELWFTATAADGILYGPAVATGISHTTDMNDVVKVTYTFKGTGEMYFSATEPDDFIEPLS